MQIESVRLENFGPFYKRHELRFPGDGSGVHLIRGENGHGKTSVNRAILWCLYGDVKDRKGQSIRPTSLLNSSAVRDDTYEMRVSVDFNHDGEQLTINRRLSARTHSDAGYRAGMHVSMVRANEPVANPDMEVRRILPSDISRFFFFDGEMLRDYEDLLDETSQAMTVLRTAIERVLGIPYLLTAREDLRAVQRGFEGERARLTRRFGGEDYEQVVKLYQDLLERSKERAEQVKSLDSQIAKLDVEIAEAKRQSATLKSVHALGEERIHLDERIESLDLSRTREVLQLQAHLAGLYKTILVRSAEDLIAKLEKRHDEVMQRYDAKQQLVGQQSQLKAAIAAQKCRLCGHVLDPAKLKQLRDDLADLKVKIDDLTDIPEPNLEFGELAHRLSLARKQSVRSPTLKESGDRITKLDHDLATARAGLANVLERLGGVDEDEPRRIELQISKSTTEVGRLHGLKEAAATAETEDLEVKSEVEQQINSIDKEELNIVGKRIELVKPLVELFDTSISVYRNEKRAAVGSLASEIFKQLRAKASFSKLEINPQFGLHIITASGAILDRAEWRSAGEEQVVALSLIGALNRSANVQAPVFMDTPFGRLDDTHGTRILRFLPKLANQVVLFVTDREFSKKDESVLADQIRSDHTVMHLGEREGSEIRSTKP